MCCCEEGSCCGPCCSLRSWFVTHVFFVTMGALDFLGLAGMMFGLASVTESAKSFVGSINSTEVADGTPALDVAGSYATFMGAIFIITAIVWTAWAVAGWILVCADMEKMYIGYVACCAVDAVLTLATIIGMLVYKDDIENGSGSGNVLLSYVAPGFSTIAFMVLRCLIFDVLPMTCLLCKRERVMDRYNGARPVASEDHELGGK